MLCEHPCGAWPLVSGKLQPAMTGQVGGLLNRLRNASLHQKTNNGSTSSPARRTKTHHPIDLRTEKHLHRPR